MVGVKLSALFCSAAEFRNQYCSADGECFCASLVSNPQSLPPNAMLIPYGTDAPIYHWPIVTGVLIVTNVLVMILQFVAPDASHAYMLALGDGVHPIQWLSACFIHAGILHLIGNMLFLWCFGIIVEGKIGSLMFAGLYLCIGAAENAALQMIYLNGEPTFLPLGASGAVMALMAIALLWAPQDNIKAWFNPALFYFFNVEIPIAFLSLLYAMWDFTIALFSDFTFGTSVAHLMGFATGLTFGTVLLLSRTIETEKRDLLSMFRELFGHEPLERKLTRKEIREEEQQKEDAASARKEQRKIYRRSIDAHLSAGNLDAAIKTQQRLARISRRADWTEPQLLKLISGFQEQSDWDRVVEFSETYLDEFDDQQTTIGLNLAKIYLLQREAPRRALKTLERACQPGKLGVKQRREMKAIQSRSQRLIDDGAIEF